MTKVSLIDVVNFDNPPLCCIASDDTKFLNIIKLFLITLLNKPASAFISDINIIIKFIDCCETLNELTEIKKRFFSIPIKWYIVDGTLLKIGLICFFPVFAVFFTIKIFIIY